MGNQLLVVFLSLIAFGFAITSNANTYTVGDNSGWDISTNLDTWEQDKKFIVGDVLGNYSFILYMCFSCYLFLLILRRYSFVLSVFQYASTDSVCEVGKESFQTCNTTNVIKCFSDGNTSTCLVMVASVLLLIVIFALLCFDVYRNTSPSWFVRTRTLRHLCDGNSSIG